MKDNSIAEMENLKASFTYAKQNNKALHFIGLVSDGGIHSHQNHLYKLCELANKEGLKKYLFMLLRMVEIAIQKAEKDSFKN